MRRPVLRGLVMALLVIALGATLFAQRGGFGRRSRDFFRGSFSSNVPYDGKFVFVRMSYPVYRGDLAWAHDYPDGERNFMTIFETITNTPSHVFETNIVAFGDPEMFKFPVIYLCEPGFWELAADEAVALRDYLVKGGFLIVDDFPAEAWRNFDLQMSRVFPTGQWIELDADHPVFHSFFEIDPYSVLSAYPELGGPPVFYGLFEDNDPTKRMYAIANYRNDLSEFWEASTRGYAVVAPDNEAYKIGINQFIYGITH
jgi:hypothetical protein